MPARRLPTRSCRDIGELGDVRVSTPHQPLVGPVLMLRSSSLPSAQTGLKRGEPSIFSTNTVITSLWPGAS
jgi:hypothetical protein